MADKFSSLQPSHIEFIERQHVFFVATAAAQGRVNLSPKGIESLRVLDAQRVVWLNLTGSGNETAAHVFDNKRMTIMLCSFDKQPMILRLYGEAEAVHPRDDKWSEYSGLFSQPVGARQYFELSIDLVQTSCGFGVPFYDFKGERPALTRWAETRGRDGIERYWREKNLISLDGMPTHILEAE